MISCPMCGADAFEWADESIYQCTSPSCGFVCTIIHWGLVRKKTSTVKHTAWDLASAYAEARGPRIKEIQLLLDEHDAEVNALVAGGKK